MQPIGGLGMPDDIAKGIVFLASDDAACMTEAGLVVDGGLTAQLGRAGAQSGSASRTAMPRTRPSAACTTAAMRSQCHGIGTADRKSVV